MNEKANRLYFELENVIEIINEYKIIDDFKEGKNTQLEFTDDKKYYVFKNINEDKTSYNIFYDSIHIRLEVSPTEKVYSIHIKKMEDVWEFSTAQGEEYCDYSHPTNQTYRVYISYDVPVLNITRASGDIYSHGAWDKYVYETINKFIENIDNCTNLAQFNKNYK